MKEKKKDHMLVVKMDVFKSRHANNAVTDYVYEIMDLMKV